MTLQQHLQTIEDINKEKDDTVNKLNKTNKKLAEVSHELETKNSECKQISVKIQDFKTNLENCEKEGKKWKKNYETLYKQYEKEIHAWEDNLAKLEKQNSEREITNSEEIRRKDRVVSGKRNISVFVDFGHF